MSLKRKAQDSADSKDATKGQKKLKTTKVFRKDSKEHKTDDSIKSKKLSKDTAATRKERKLNRKKQKPNFELSRETLQLWEKLRVNKAKLPKGDRMALVDQLLTAARTQDKSLVGLTYAHDTSRVLQSCLKQGSSEQREKIFQDLKGEILSMIKNQYSKNIVWKMLKYGTSQQRDAIIRQFAGVVPKLIRKQGPAGVIEFAYNVYANKDQRNFLVHQLYGNSFNISKSRDDATLEDVLKDQPEKRLVILGNFKQSLVPLIDKQVILHTIVHRVFSEFFTFCSDNEDQLRSELIELLRDSVIHMMHTRDGAHTAMHCLWYGTAKDRKVILKTMKEFIAKLCKEEFGHLVLLAAFDCVDDTVFMNKALITPIVKMIPEIIHNKYARKVLLYLVSPRNKSHFLPETIGYLCKGDGNNHSKKPMETRQKELSEAVSPGLISYLTSSLGQFVRDRSLHTLVEVVVNFSQVNTTELTSLLIQLLSVPFASGLKNDAGQMHIIEDPAGHLLIKHLILQKEENGRVHFAATLMKEVDLKKLCSWCSCNRGSQVLLSLLKCSVAEVANSTKEILRRNQHVLKEHDSIKSTRLLMEKLAN